jgi:hypothetical protein
MWNTPSIYDSPVLDIGRTGRSAAPLRVAFLHEPRREGLPGPLASFVEERRGIALDLLLLAHATASLSGDRPIRATSSQWMKAIGAQEGASNRVTVSRSWTWLEQKNLVRSHRAGRDRGIEVLREDGSGERWQPPMPRREAHFGLPHDYWLCSYPQALSLPAKAVLLIALSLQSRGEEFFELPLERGSRWYGLSESTLRRGLGELRRQGLLRHWVRARKTAESPIGRTYDQRYALNRFPDLTPVGFWAGAGGSPEEIPF